jgi:multicomponent Na+:H+ antiporter subunit D
VTMVALLGGGLLLGLVPGLADDAVGAAARFVDRSAYATAVLTGGASPGAVVPVPAAGAAVHVPSPTLKDYLLALLTVLGALALAATALVRGPLRDVPTGRAGHALRTALSGLRRLHSGHVGDYITWLVVGTVVLGAAWAASLS